MTEPKEILRDYVSDMLAVENHILHSLERQTRDDRVRTYREAYELLMKLETTMSAHTLTLERYLASTNGSSGPESFIKKAATTAIGAMTGFYSKMRPGDPVSRDLRDDYTALSLATISYTMLHTTARSLGENDLAEMALKHLKELTPFVAGLSRIIPTIVAQELVNQGKGYSTTAGEEAVADTQKAWSREVIGQ